MGELCKTLRDEHRVIERVLIAMASESVRLDGGYAINADFVRSAMTYLHEYVDVFHHSKEENILFPALEQAGLPRSNSPIEEMFNDHSHGQRLVSAIEDIIDPAVIGDATAVTRIANCMREFVEMSRRHIEQEENYYLIRILKISSMMKMPRHILRGSIGLRTRCRIKSD